MNYVPEPEVLRFWYFNQVKNFKPLAEDINHYLRAEHDVNSNDFTFEWLWAASCRHLKRRRSDYMQGELNRTLHPAKHNAAPGVNGPAAPGKGTYGKSGKKDKA